MRKLTDYMTQFIAAYRQHLYIVEDDLPVLKLLLGAATAQHLGERTELFWLVLIGPSAAAKTAMLNPIISCKDLVVSRDDCTGSAMMSASDPEGHRALARAAGDDDPFDPSLASIIHEKLFVIKDMTLLLNRKDEADKFWGHLRAAYDGRLEKQSGTIGYQGEENIRFGFIGATTDGSIDGSLVRMSKLGERATYVRMHQDPTTQKHDRNMGLRMLSNRGHQHLREKKLSDRVNAILHRAIKQVKRMGPSDPRIHPQSVLIAVIDLASALAKIRTAPAEEAHLPHERNARLVKQFGTLCDVVSICSGRRRWTKSEVELCVKIVRCSLPTKIRLLLDYVATCSFFNNPRRWPTASSAATAIGAWRASTVESQLRQWVNAGLLSVDGNRRFRVLPEVLHDFVKLGIIIRPTRRG